MKRRWKCYHGSPAVECTGGCREGALSNIRTIFDGLCALMRGADIRVSLFVTSHVSCQAGVVDSQHRSLITSPALSSWRLMMAATPSQKESCKVGGLFVTVHF